MLPLLPAVHAIALQSTHTLTVNLLLSTSNALSEQTEHITSAHTQQTNSMRSVREAHTHSECVSAHALSVVGNAVLITSPYSITILFKILETFIFWKILNV